MASVDEFHTVLRQLEELRVSADIPPFAEFHANLPEGILVVGWPEGLDLVIVMEEANLKEMAPSMLRQLWLDEQGVFQAAMN